MRYVGTNHTRSQKFGEPPWSLAFGPAACEDPSLFDPWPD